MSARDRRSAIDNSSLFDDDGDAPTLKQADAALYGALMNVDKNRGAQKRTEFGAFKITNKGLSINGNATEKDWREIGEFLFAMEGSIQWLIGDWLAYGEDVKWGDTADIAASLERETQTLYNYTSVARSIEFSRRREELSFSHHEAVSKLDPVDQDTALKCAVEMKMSVSNFRRWLKGESAAPALPAPVAPDAVSSKQVQRFEDYLYRQRALVVRAQPRERAQMIIRLESLLAELKKQ